MNLGELVTDASNKAKVKVSTDLQAFALIVTAEPYFSVTHPSDAVVMDNVLEPGTQGRVEALDAKYELLPRKLFTFDPARQTAVAEGPKLSMGRYEAQVAVYQAQNAIQIAKSAGAGTYAADTLQKAEQLYQQAVELNAKKSSSREVVTAAREAAQTAEDARAITVKRQEEGERSRIAPPGS
jgi:multidrug resistance efflux pump